VLKVKKEVNYIYSWLNGNWCDIAEEGLGDFVCNYLDFGVVPGI
jgi:hypothetical protein